MSQLTRRQLLVAGATGALAACTRPLADSGGDTLLGPPAPIALNLQPWVHFTNETTALLRFESLEEADFVVQFWADGSEASPQTAALTVDARELDFAWPGIELPDSADVLPDLPGLHALYTATLDDLPAGAVVHWRLHRGGGETSEGSLRTPPSAAAEVRIAWIADTMHPYSTDPFLRLADLTPHLVLHGGDIQYQSSPADTWAGMSVKLAPTAARAPVWFAVGNHENEGQDELVVMYERLLGDQGMPATEGRWFRVQWGHVCVLMLDSEDGSTRDPDSAQVRWLDAELAAANDRGDVLIVGFHRPLYTLSKHASEDTSARDVLHPRFVDAGVRLVLTGHVHAFERFDVDGVVYWVDGGGGALLYNPDEEAADVEAWRPGEGALRVAVDKAYGITSLVVRADGSLVAERIRADDGSVAHSLTLEA